MNKIFMTLICLLFFTQTIGGAMDETIKFDGATSQTPIQRQKNIFIF